MATTSPQVRTIGTQRIASQTARTIRGDAAPKARTPEAVAAIARLMARRDERLG